MKTPRPATASDIEEVRNLFREYAGWAFKEIAPYNNNPIPGTLIMELKFDTPGRITAPGGRNYGSSQT